MSSSSLPSTQLLIKPKVRDAGAAAAVITTGTSLSLSMPCVKHVACSWVSCVFVGIGAGVCVSRDTSHINADRLELAPLYQIFVNQNICKSWANIRRIVVVSDYLKILGKILGLIFPIGSEKYFNLKNLANFRIIFRP